MKKTKMAGSGIYAEAVAETDSKFAEGRVPCLGDKIEFADGRKYVFVSVNTSNDITAGQGLAEAQEDTVIEDQCSVASANANEVTITLTGGSLTASSGLIGKSNISDIGENDFAETYLAVTQDTGAGYLYKIKSNTIPDSGSSYSVTLTLYDRLVEGIDGTTDVAFVVQRFTLCGQSGADGRLPIGVACVDAKASTDSEVKYLWAQYAGPCVVNGGLTTGDGAVCDASGGFKDSTADVLTEMVGTTIVADENFSIVDLNLKL